MDLRSVKAGAVALVALVASATGLQAQGIAGPYLAASQADLRNDYDEASDFYAQLLLRDSSNGVLLQNALMANIASARFDPALLIAERLLAVSEENQIGALMMVAEAFRTEEYSAAQQILVNEDYRLSPLLAGLLQGWAAVGHGDYEAALTAFDSLDHNDTLRVYGQLNKALALALAGDCETAATIIDGDENGPLHMDRMAVLAHISCLSQSDRSEEAITMIDNFLGDGFSDTHLSDLRDILKAGETIPFDVVEDAGDGAAMTFHVIASALSRDRNQRVGLIYARLATHIDPGFDEATILTAEILDAQEQYDQAIEAYAQIKPESHWYISAEVGRSSALEASGKVDQASEVLSNLAREKPDNLSIQTALGDVMRRAENFGPSVEAYTTALNLIDEENTSHWVLHYSRGIGLERLGRWDEAEADLRRALELQPDQPLVLNYLGYSLVELRQNLDEAQGMIEKAVAARPDDGYITDSLGWVLYRLGKYEEAVPHMERAVALVPVDPIINDHLGDVLWMVGRKLEAEFQWKRALSFDPEEDEAERIRRKLQVGLDQVLKDEADGAEETETAHDG